MDALVRKPSSTGWEYRLRLNATFLFVISQNLSYMFNTQSTYMFSSPLILIFLGGGGKKSVMQINTSKTKNDLVCQTASNDLLCSKVHCGTISVDARTSPDGSSGSYYTAFFSAAPLYLTAPASPQLLSLSPYLYARRQFPGWVKLG